MFRILVVDDDPVVRSVVADALRLEGHAVACVCNGRQALSALGKCRPEAIVLDLVMPEMDGPTLVRTLREQTRWGRLPLVVISGAAQAQATSARLGACACIGKPFELSEVLDAVDGVVSAAPSPGSPRG